MDKSKIIEKALEGQDYTEDIKDFSDDEKLALNLEIKTKADEAAKTALDKAVALRKEAARVENKLNPEGKKDETPKDDDGFTQFRKEQVEKAKNRLFSEYELTDAQKAEVVSKFEKLDSGKTDADFIYNDFVSAFAAANSTDLVSAKKQIDENKKNANDFNSQGAFNQGTQSIPDEAKYSEAAKTIYRAWQKAGYGPEYTIEKAQKVADKK